MVDFTGGCCDGEGGHSSQGAVYNHKVYGAAEPRHLDTSFQGGATPENKQLLNKTNERAKEQGFEYMWSREVEIFVRWEKGEKCIKVEGIDELEKL